ncbi:MAG: hypothetical protein WCP58_02000 [bacterium]
MDVFYARLNFSHPVEFGRIPGKGRLELDFPTIALADIVLEKLQIHFINKKDLIDLILLFCGHELAETDQKWLTTWPISPRFSVTTGAFGSTPRSTWRKSSPLPRSFTGTAR